jgi:hypothetical protein
MNTLKKILVVAGVLGLGSALASPASAQPTQAYASGSSTMVLLNGASMSIGGEIAAPSGAGFVGATNTDGNVLVTPVYEPAAADPINSTEVFAAVDANNIYFAGLTVDPGTATLPPPATPTSVEAAVATLISAQAPGGVVAAGGLPVVTSYIRAWQSGLE